MLTELQAKNAKQKDKRYMLFDSEGLYLEVTPNGTKSWRFRYKVEGKEHKLTLGRYPVFSLKEAREVRNDMRKKLAMGEDVAAPGKAAGVVFEDLYDEYLRRKCLPTLSETRIKSIRQKIVRHVLPRVGRKPVNDINEVQMLDLLRAIEGMGFKTTAHSVRGICGQIFRFGIAAGKCGRDPTAALQGALTPIKTEHRARLQGKENIGALLRAIDEYKGVVVRSALQLEAYLFLRPKEIRSLEWSEVEWGDRLIRIPAEKMKMKKEHLVPLARQSLKLLEDMKPVTGHGRFVFPSPRTPSGSRCLSDAALLSALRRMGYTKDEMCVHGFKGIASTELYESGKWSPDAIERQLAHVEGNSVKAAYSYAQYLDERREMMQWWGDYLNKLKTDDRT